jgi:hypothetical protein
VGNESVEIFDTGLLVSLAMRTPAGYFICGGRSDAIHEAPSFYQRANISYGFSSLVPKLELGYEKHRPDHDDDQGAERMKTAGKSDPMERK